jgi:hypothetical protein
MKSKLVAGALASAVTFATTLAASATTLSDGNFSGTIDVTTSSGSPSLTANGSVSTTVGNPANSLDAAFSYSASTSATATVTFIDHSLSYDPSILGAISSINASYDRELTVVGSFTPGLAINYRLVIEQDGSLYSTAIPVCSACDPTSQWMNLAQTGLVASQFTLLGGSTNPNFSGDPILFGVEAVFATNQTSITAANIYLDNIDITVTQTPLPAALPLFASGLGGVGLLGWRRKRKNASAVAAS